MTRQYTSELKWVIWIGSTKYHELHDDYKIALSRAEELARGMNAKELELILKEDGGCEVITGEIGSLQHYITGRLYQNDDGEEVLLYRGVTYNYVRR